MKTFKILLYVRPCDLGEDPAVSELDVENDNRTMNGPETPVHSKVYKVTFLKIQEKPETVKFQDA